jgi:hypothetical protein
LLHCDLAKVGFTSLFGARSCSTHPELLSQYINDQYLFESLLHCDLAKVGFTSLFGARSNRCHSPTRPSRGLFIFWDCKCKYVYPFFKVFTQISKSEDAINKQNQFIIR